MDQGLKYIEPKINGKADLKIRSFYYTDTLSFSVSQEVKKDASFIRDDCILFYFMNDNTLLENIYVPIKLLLEYEEVWVRYNNKIDNADLYATDIFNQYSYFLMNPY